MALNFSGGTPGPVSRTSIMRASPARCAPHFHPAILFDRLQRIDHQIQQRLNELDGIGHHRRQVIAAGA